MNSSANSLATLLFLLKTLINHIPGNLGSWTSRNSRWMALHCMYSKSNLFWMHSTSCGCVEKTHMGDKTLHLGCGNVLSFSSSSLKKRGKNFFLFNVFQELRCQLLWMKGMILCFISATSKTRGWKQLGSLFLLAIKNPFYFTLILDVSVVCVGLRSEITSERIWTLGKGRGEENSFVHS